MYAKHVLPASSGRFPNTPAIFYPVKRLKDTNKMLVMKKAF